MAYRLKKSDTSLGAALRRIAREQIDRALAAVDRPGENEKGIHKARACCKKLRGLIRLVRPGFVGFEEENAAFRDAAKALERLRAGGAARETLDRLARAAPERLDHGALAEIRAGFDAEAVPRLATDRTADAMYRGTRRTDPTSSSTAVVRSVRPSSPAQACIRGKRSG